MNMKTRWDATLKVGSEVIDNQHKVLFDLIQDLDNAIKTGASLRILDVILSVLRDYAFQHFQTEEEFFVNNADYTQHCLAHYTLLKSLNAFILDFKNNRVKGEQTTADFLEEWLFDHIEVFDKPFLTHDTVNKALLHDAGAIDGFETEDEDRRLHKRIPHTEVVDGDIHAHCYNATKLKSGTANIVDMSPGGLMLGATGGHNIDDLLIISCSIGRNFKMKEKVQVKTVHDGRYGVQFVAPTKETIDFFTKLYGSVHLNRARIS